MNENIEIFMIRKNLDHILDFPLPDGFRIRTYREGDDQAWVRIHELADLHNPVTLATFEDQFGYDLAALKDRSFFLETTGGEVIGTATAWYNLDFEGQSYGRVHWVAIIPPYQGQGLSKPLMTCVLKRLAASHDRCYLVTSSARIPAIQLYLKFGFQSFIRTTEDLRIWDILEGELRPRK